MRLLKAPATADNTAVAGAQLAHDIIIANPAESLEPHSQAHHPQQQHQHHRQPQHYQHISAMHVVDVQRLKMAKSAPTPATNSNRRRKQHKTKAAQQLQSSGGDERQYHCSNNEQHVQNAVAGVKSRSLERYAKPPHAAMLALEQESALTPNLNTSPRRRHFLSPFKSLKRRSRSSSSSGGGSSRCDSRDVTVAAMLAMQREHQLLQQQHQHEQHEHQPGERDQQRAEQLTAAQTLLQQHVAKRAQHLHSTSSQSGDSGTGGTELEMELQDCSRTSAAASSQLSLSFSQLSSGGDGGDVDDDSSIDAAAADVVAAAGRRECANVERSAAERHVAERQLVEQSVADQSTNGVLMENGVDRDVDVKEEEEEEARNFAVTVDDLDASFAEEETLHTIGNITLVDDTYSNYDPKNDAERMFLQVVGILRDENEKVTNTQSNMSTATATTTTTMTVNHSSADKVI
ncbi:PREDICTED: dystrophin-like [Rhagoletis zephyria]|uniref:dystrophin-like n=1 Tax=Rhagoletis zephyria TaxID=28612 RepID=UPI0008119F2B|nr:PREDICTED: dystrophin-like [Rhagoletis zephyria]